MVLLNSIEEWGSKHQIDKKTGKKTIFAQLYDELKEKGYCFPSAWKIINLRRFGSADP